MLDQLLVWHFFSWNCTWYYARISKSDFIQLETLTYRNDPREFTLNAVRWSTRRRFCFPFLQGFDSGDLLKIAGGKEYPLDRIWLLSKSGFTNFFLNMAYRFWFLSFLFFLQYWALSPGSSHWATISPILPTFQILRQDHTKSLNRPGWNLILLPQSPRVLGLQGSHQAALRYL